MVIGADEERRSLPRMTMRVECRCQLRALDSGEVVDGSVKELSGAGALVWCDQELQEQARIELRIPPALPSSAPLVAVGVVVRCEPAVEGGQNALALEFSRVS